MYYILISSVVNLNQILWFESLRNAKLRKKKAQPSITWGEPARVGLNFEAVVSKDGGYIKKHESSGFLLSPVHYFGVLFSVYGVIYMFRTAGARVISQSDSRI